MHDWHVAHGALMHDFGEWRRPVVYLQSGGEPGSGDQREPHTVRTAAGLFDGSSLGKSRSTDPMRWSFWIASTSMTSLL